jgi:hypothetical protein
LVVVVLVVLVVLVLVLLVVVVVMVILWRNGGGIYNKCHSLNFKLCSW